MSENPKKENTTKTQHFLNRKIKKIYNCISVKKKCFLKILRHSIVDWYWQSIPASCCSLPLRWPQRLQIVSSIIFWSHDSYPYAAYRQRATRTHILCIVNNCSDQTNLLCSYIVNDMLSWCMLFLFPTGCWFGKTELIIYDKTTHGLATSLAWLIMSFEPGLLLRAKHITYTKHIT